MIFLAERDTDQMLVIPNFCIEHVYIFTIVNVNLIVISHLRLNGSELLTWILMKAKAREYDQFLRLR